MKIRIYSILLFLCIVSALYAVPAKPGMSKITQPDGYQLATLQRGDETFHYRTTTDQYVLLQDVQGYFVYAQQGNNGELVASEIRAHNMNERSEQEIAFLQTIKPNLPFGTVIRQSVKLKLLNKKAQSSRRKVEGEKSKINPHYLVILVEFSDNSFAASDDNARFTAQLNGDNYTTDGATGSAKKYFTDNSMGSFSPTFDVYGPVKLDNPMAYYGGNDASGNDMYPDKMVSEACQKLDGSIDFSNYDANNDGSVDNVFVIYAGYGEASGGTKNTIWPHAGGVYDNVLLDGVLLDGYGCTCELQESGIIDGIGTMCHEFTHVIGLPDFYDTDYATNGEAYGTQSWDLMGGGNYNNYSMTPPYYTAIERQMMGWGTPTMLTSGNYALAPVSTNQFFRIDTPTPNEYYLFENRQQSGWDYFISGHGMLVYHVDKTSVYQSYWDDNKINAYSAHPCMEIVPAGGTFAIGSESSQPFPGTSSNDRITDFTTINLKSWSGASLGKGLVNIIEAGDQVSFLMLNTADLLLVEAVDATNINTTSFTANWTATNSNNTKLNVYQKTSVGNSSQDFSTIPSSPWESVNVKTSSSTFSTNSARFYIDAAYLISEQYPDAISNISFSIKTYAAGDGCTSTLNILASTDKSSWELLKTCTSSSDAAIVTVPVDLTKNYRYFKFVFNKTDLDICVDDINITYGGVKTYTLQNTNVTAATTYNVTGLNIGQKYFFTLNAANTNETAVSNEIQVQLSSIATDYNTISKNRYKISAFNHTINVISPDITTLRIYNEIGQLVTCKQLQVGNNQIPVSTTGIYIVRMSDSFMKLIVE